jgi:hypothetical protein
MPGSKADTDMRVVVPFRAVTVDSWGSVDYEFAGQD